MNLEDFLNQKLKKGTMDVVIAFENGDILEDSNYNNYFVSDCVYRNKEAYITVISKNENNHRS